MAKGKHEVVKGDDWKFDFQYTENGDPKSIAGAMEIKACVKGDTAAVEVTKTALEITVTNAEAGKGTIKFPKSKTPDVKKGTQKLTVKLTDADGDLKTLILPEFLEVVEADC